MDFEKTSISTKVTKFLQENLKDKKDKESLQNIITEKGLLKNDAINLLITILQALTIPDSTDEEEITVGNPIEKDEEDSPTQKVSDGKQGSSKDAIAEDKNIRSTQDKAKICRFYNHVPHIFMHPHSYIDS